VEVTDDLFISPDNPHRIEEGDSIQFAMAPDDGASWYYEYGAALIDSKPVLVKLNSPPGQSRGVVERADLEIRRLNGRTVYRLSIPWDDVPPLRPAVGKELPFNIAVNDRDYPGQPRAWMEWTPGMIVEKDISLFGRLRFVRR